MDAFAFGSLFALLAMNVAVVAVAGTCYGIKRLLMISKSRHLENDAEAKQISNTKALIYEIFFSSCLLLILAPAQKQQTSFPLPAARFVMKITVKIASNI